MGPPEQDAEWNDEAVAGRVPLLRAELAHRAADRRGRHAESCRDVGDPARARTRASLELARKAHWAIDKVTRDISERLHFNTAIAACMELLNELVVARRTRRPAVQRFAAGVLCSLAQPFVPHVSEELWSRLGGTELWREPWPKADPRYLEHDSVTIVVQVNGKLRGKFDSPVGLDREQLVERARVLDERALATSPTRPRSCA